MMPNLKELFLRELSAMYDSEKQLTKALARFAQSASTAELREVFEFHLELTETHIERLDEIFKILKQKPRTNACAPMRALIADSEEYLKDKNPSQIKDAALIAAGEKIEHYEIASYGCLSVWSRALENEEISDLLQETIDEEEEAHEKFNEIAERTIEEDMDVETVKDLEEEGSLSK
jgi:ferritin-like metal-binding protein YciE